MSATAVILTSEQCGHCRNMRGTGRLLSRNEIKSGNKQPTIPGNYHYDAIFMKKLITAETESPKVRVININLKTFDISKGVADISVFILDNDNTTVKQTMLTEKGGKTQMNMWAISESGKVLLNNEVDKPWSEVVSEYLPVNLGMYAFFFPSLIVFDSRAWADGISRKAPLYGYLNGFDTKDTLPYGALPNGNPKTLEWSKFLKQFYDGTKKLLGVPEVVLKEEKKVHFEEDKDVVPSVSEKIVVKTPASSEVKKDGVMRVMTPGSEKLRFKLYVVE